MISCEPNDLIAAAKCFWKLSTKQVSQVKVYLLCQIANGGPPFTPSAPTLEVNSSNGNVVATNVDCPGHPADAPTASNWEGAISATGTGDPTSNPGGWTAGFAPNSSNGCIAQWNTFLTSLLWGAVRYRTGGVWSPWGKIQRPSTLLNGIQLVWHFNDDFVGVPGLSAVFDSIINLPLTMQAVGLDFPTINASGKFSNCIKWVSPLGVARPVFGNNGNLHFGTGEERTISFWLFQTGPGASAGPQQFMGVWNEGDDAHSEWQIKSDGAGHDLFILVDQNDGQIIETVASTFGAFVNYVVTWDGIDTLTIFKNNVSIAGPSSGVINTLPAQSFYSGNDQSGSLGFCANNRIDEINVWNRVLEAAG